MQPYQSEPFVPDGYELIVSPCKTRLWVNADDGSCVARFSKRFGSDLHRTGSEIMAGSSECLHCTHGVASVEVWNDFRARLQAAYRVSLPENTLSY